MPQFSEYKDVEVEAVVDVSVEEFLDECMDSDIHEVIKWLREEDYLKEADLLRSESLNASESFYEEALDKLHGKWNRLSKEEEQIIILLGSKF